MKIRKLKEILGDTGYIISNGGNQLNIGNKKIPHILSVDKKTQEIKYHNKTIYTHRFSLVKEILDIYSKLRTIIANGELHDILKNNDIIEDEYTVFLVRENKVIETYTDILEEDNITIEGYLMDFDSTFTTKEKAVEYVTEKLDKENKKSESLIDFYNDKMERIIDNIETEKEKIKENIQLIENFNK